VLFGLARFIEPDVLEYKTHATADEGGPCRFSRGARWRGGVVEGGPSITKDLGQGRQQGRGQAPMAGVLQCPDYEGRHDRDRRRLFGRPGTDDQARDLRALPQARHSPRGDGPWAPLPPVHARGDRNPPRIRDRRTDLFEEPERPPAPRPV